MSKRVSAAAAKARLAEVLRDVERDGPVIITRYGRDVAAIVTAEQLGEYERLRAAEPKEGLQRLVGLWTDGDELIHHLPTRSWARELPDLEG